MIDYDFVAVEMSNQAGRTLLENLRLAVMKKVSIGWTVHGQPFQQGNYLCQTIVKNNE